MGTQPPLGSSERDAMTHHTPQTVSNVPETVNSVIGSLNSSHAMMAVVGGVR